MHKKIISITIIIFILIFFLPLKLLAQKNDFNPNNIISNYELFDYDSMSLQEIQDFLNKHNGVLKTYKAQDFNGKDLKASKIIFNASQKYKINPQVLLTLLQKEQTLITTPPEKDTQLKWATGFAAYDHRSPVKRFGGFGIQIDRTAWRLRYYLEHPWDFRHKVGQTYSIDYYKVTPETSATAVLYNYTPHIQGNKLFFKIWDNWFNKESGTLQNGSLVRAENKPGVYLIDNNEKRPFTSKSIFLSRYKFKDVQEINPKKLSTYKTGEPIRFPNYSLIQGSLGELFLLDNNQKRAISQSMFKKIGFHPDEIIQADKKALEIYKQGKPVVSPYPSGSLLQNQNTKAVFYVKDNTKHPIIDATILHNNYPYNAIIKVRLEELNKFEDGPAIKFRDGTLIKTKNKNTVYLIAKGKARPIYSSQIFNALGYNWNHIITVSKDILNIHPQGKVFKLEGQI